ncbi:MAG: DUF1289 domain-containing protein [Methylobacter sp.]|nr:DUF1289 domain-containing protein [Methylobacter sp.]MDP1667013.1 DUF1289 domain-containing protein [Methylobacter sp.]
MLNQRLTFRTGHHAPFSSGDSSLENIISPCVRDCCLNEEDVCLGCFRSIDEILQWSDATEQQKQKIIHLANARKLSIDLNMDHI